MSTSFTLLAAVALCTAGAAGAAGAAAGATGATGAAGGAAGATGATGAGCTYLHEGLKCPDTLRYRPIDGSCNNLKKPWLGRVNTPLLRLVPHEYSDPAGGPRLSRSRKPLPSAQRVVRHLFPEKNVTHFTSHLFVIWGQLISHDFVRSQAPRNQARGPCCDKNAGSECFSIEVAKDDPFYSQFNVVCLPMQRTNRTTCEGPYPEQLSATTHYLDASFVYGSDPGTMWRLRRRRGGQLRARRSRSRCGPEFPPDVPNPKAFCGFKPCYDTGDIRANQNPLLAALQVVFLREHNRVARILAKLNRKWDDERLFQESRRVVVAEWQLINYRDWLQWLLGVQRVRDIGLVPGEQSERSEYREDLDPRTTNDFATASYRSLHSMVQGQFPARSGTTALGLWFENPGPLLETRNGMLDIVQGMVYQVSQEQNRWEDREMTEQLRPVFEKDGRRWGNNLVGLDIQRGRDHGIASYNSYREYVGLGRARDFNGLRDTLDQEYVKVLEELYEHVDDVDYYVGGLLEANKGRDNGPVAGPTFLPVLEDQFKRWRFGDRFFYNFVGFEHSFTKEQLKALQGTSATRLFCDNVSGFKKGPKDPFIRVGHDGNEEQSCRELPRVDFSAWKES